MSDFEAKCTKFNFGWGSASHPAGRAYSAPSDPLAGLREPTSKGRGGKGTRRGERTGRGGGAEGRGRDSPLHTPPQSIFLDMS